MKAEDKKTELFDSCLFPKIFMTFRMAIQPTKLIIAFLAIAVICLAGWTMDFSRSVVVVNGADSELGIYLTSPEMVPHFIEHNTDTGQRAGVFSTLWQFAGAKFHGALNSLFSFNLPGVAANIGEYFKAIEWAIKYHWIYCIIFFAITLAVMSVAGGAICRISALQFARDERPGLTEALRYGTQKFINFFTAPLVPVGIIIFIGAFIFLLGLLGNIPRVGELMIGIFSPLVLLGGTLIALVSIGIIAGFNLMYPAVAYDGSDCFDAISRSFSYVYSRPWRMGFYGTVAGVYGAICYSFVRFFAFLILWVSHQFLQFGILVKNSEQVSKLTAIWQEPRFTNFGLSGSNAANWSESVAAFLIYLSALVIVGLVVSFVISFYFSANTIIYSLMRNKVDNTAFEDIYTYSEETLTPSSNTEVTAETKPNRSGQKKTDDKT